MSASQNRHSFASFFSSKMIGKRWRSRMATAARSSKRRSLRMEALERRELMAGDVASAIRHNSLVPTDVNGDFDISPVDALQVINAMNRQTRGVLAVGSSMYDVNNDGALSPIDALIVINRLKTGEGVGELAAVDIQVLMLPEHRLFQRSSAASINTRLLQATYSRFVRSLAICEPVRSASFQPLPISTMQRRGVRRLS